MTPEVAVALVILGIIIGVLGTHWFELIHYRHVVRRMLDMTSTVMEPEWL